MKCYSFRTWRRILRTVISALSAQHLWPISTADLHSPTTIDRRILRRMVWFSKCPWYWPLPIARIYKEEQHRLVYDHWIRYGHRHLPSCMFTLWRCTQHWNIWHNNNIVFRSIRQFLVEYKCLLLVKANGSVHIFHNVHFFPCFSIWSKIRRKLKID